MSTRRCLLAPAIALAALVASCATVPDPPDALVATTDTTAPTDALATNPTASTVAPNGAEPLPSQSTTAVETGSGAEQIGAPNGESPPTMLDSEEPVGTPVDVAAPAVEAAPPGVSSAPLRIALYGDSIGVEIYPYLAFFANNLRPVIVDRNVYGGTNACDWFDEAERDARTFRPDIVITLFIGNDLTPCTRPAGQYQTPAKIAWRTVADTNALALLFTDDVPVYRVGYARSARQQTALDESDAGNAIDGIRYLLAMSSTNQMRYIDGSEVLLENGRYTDTLACSVLDGANCGDDGRVQVRAAGGVHLCPSVSGSEAGVIDPCPVQSSGAARLAAHFLQIILQPAASS